MAKAGICQTESAVCESPLLAHDKGRSLKDFETNISTDSREEIILRRFCFVFLCLRLDEFIQEHLPNANPDRPQNHPEPEELKAGRVQHDRKLK